MEFFARKALEEFLLLTFCSTRKRLWNAATKIMVGIEAFQLILPRISSYQSSHITRKRKRKNEANEKQNESRTKETQSKAPRQI